MLMIGTSHRMTGRGKALYLFIFYAVVCGEGCQDIRLRMCRGERCLSMDTFVSFARFPFLLLFRGSVTRV